VTARHGEPGRPEPVDGVAHWLVGELVGGDGSRTPVDVDLSWEWVDPLTVRIRFVAPDVVWLVGRELLGEGLVRPTGRGDVQVCLLGARAQVWVSAPDGCADVRLDAAEVTDFLVATYRAVGPDEATAIVHTQLEAGLATLLDQPGGVS
jgi:hypothetical protein